MNIYNEFRTVPTEAKKSITGGRLKGFTDINPMWRIKKLTEKFGTCGFGWKYEIISQELKEGAKGEISSFITINLYVKVGDIWSEPIPGIGGSMFVANERSGPYTSDECFKMALTDAISVSCKALGMGADVYFEKDKTKYDQGETVEKAQTNPENVQLDEGDMITIKLALESFTKSSEIAEYWRNNKNLHSNKDFFAMVAKRGKELKMSENENK